jgi:D-proline reductase (dithiol) PrdB
MDVVEKAGEFNRRFERWIPNDRLNNYPWVQNTRAPFTPLRRALPLLNLGLISSAGAFIVGTDPFDVASKDGDLSFREFPLEVDAADMDYAAKGYDAAAVREDRNSLIPIDRLLEFEGNAIIGRLNNVWWSVSSHIPNAVRVARELAPQIVERLKENGVHAALLVPASRLGHQTLGIIARAIEAEGMPSMLISVDTSVTDMVRPPRTAYYRGELGSISGKPNYREYQFRVLDEAIRWIETFDQPGARKLAVDLETQVEVARGER